MPAPEALGGEGKPAILVRVGTPDHSARNSPHPHRSQLGSPDGSLAPGRSRRLPSNRSGIDALLQGARGDCGAGKDCRMGLRASQTYSNAIQPCEQMPRWPGLCGGLPRGEQAPLTERRSFTFSLEGSPKLPKFGNFSSLDEQKLPNFPDPREGVLRPYQNGLI
jgi:hypothetical protein